MSDRPDSTHPSAPSAARGLPAGLGTCILVALALLAGGAVASAGGRHGTAGAAPRATLARARAASVAPVAPAVQNPKRIGRGGPIAFQRSACLRYAPAGRWNGETVFVDPGHGGVDPGATPLVEGRRLEEKQATLGLGLNTLRVLEENGYRVVMSRVDDSTVARTRPGAVHQGVLTAEGAQREIEARNLCADAAHAQVLVALHMDSFSDPSARGAATFYSPGRPFAARSRRLGDLVQRAIVAAMRSSRVGGTVVDRGLLPDSAAGGLPLTPQTANYHHLIELGPADLPWLPYPSLMPGVLVEPAFLSNPGEASFVLSARGQDALARALAKALGTYFRKRPTSTATAVAARRAPSPRPTAHPHPVISGRIPDRLPTGKHVVALTFDAGADNAAAPKILAALARAGVPATFFMTGRWAQLYPQWARRIAARYPIGNHTFDHTDLLRLTLPQVSAEVLGAKAAIARATGHPPVPLFRFPYGSSNAATLQTVNRLGYTAVGWTVDTLGWEGTSLGQSVASVRTRALAHLEPGEIMLMHVGANPSDHSTLDGDALPGIINAIKARGYGFTTLPSYF